MRNWNFLIRSLLGVAALSTVAACHNSEDHVVRSTPIVSTPAPLAPRTIVPPVPTPPVAVAPPVVEEPVVADEDEGEKATKELVKDARDALSAGELDRALRLARLAVLKSPDHSGAWNTLGRAQLRRGERAAAIESFQQAVELKPSSAWAQNNYGLALLYDERYEEAVTAFEEATDNAPDIGLMWNNLGMAYEHLDRIEEARTAYKRAMTLEHRPATQNFVRIEGVRSLKRTAKADPGMIDEDHPAMEHGL